MKRTITSPNGTLTATVSYQFEHYEGREVGSPIAVLIRPSVQFGRLMYLEGGPESDGLFLSDEILIVFDAKALLALNFKTQECFHFLRSPANQSTPILLANGSLVIIDGQNERRFSAEQIQLQWAKGLGPCEYGRLPTARPLPPKTDPQFNN